MSKLATWWAVERSLLSLRHVLVLAIVARVLLPLLAFTISSGDPLFHAGDTNSYIRPAQALLSEGTYTRNAKPELIRTPGYPMLLLPGIALGHVETITIGLQILISTATVFLVYKIALLLFRRSEIAIASAALFAIDPISILYSSRLLSETLFTALTTLFIYLLLRYWKGGSLTYLAASATALAASAYVRPISYYLPILVAAILFIFVLVKREKDARNLLHIGIFLGICFGLMGVWQLRNKIETGYSGFSAASPLSLYYWDAAYVLAVVEDTPYLEMRRQMGYGDQEALFRNFPEIRGAEISERYAAMGRAGMEIILGNLGIYSGLVARGLVQSLLDPGATELMRMFRLYPEAGGLLTLMISEGIGPAIEILIKEMPVVFWSNLILVPVLLSYLLFAVLGFIQSRRMFSMPMILFSAITTYLLILSAAGIGTSRARHPIMPMVCVLAGYGVYRIVRSRRTKSLPRKAELLPTI